MSDKKLRKEIIKLFDNKKGPLPVANIRFHLKKMGYDHNRWQDITNELNRLCDSGKLVKPTSSSYRILFTSRWKTYATIFLTMITTIAATVAILDYLSIDILFFF